MTSLSVRLKSPAELSDLDWARMTEWRNASGIYDDPMFAPELIRLVANLREDVRLLIIESKDGPVGYWPILLRPGGWGRPVLGPFSDLHGPILAPDFVDVVRAEDVLKASPLSGTTFPAIPLDLSRQSSADTPGSAIADYSQGWETYISEQTAEHPKHFKKMRRLERKIDREVEQAQFTLNDESDEAFDWLIQTKRSQYEATGKHDVLQAQWASEFLSSLRGFETPRLKVRLSTLSFDGTLVASELNMWSDKVLHGWITAINPDYRSFSPGYLLMQWVMEQSATEGIETSDLGPGQLDYKKYYTNAFIALSSLTGKKEGKVRPLGDLWSGFEKLAPSRMAHQMGRMRRRSDQICASEPDFGARLKGHANALLKSRP